MGSANGDTQVGDQRDISKVDRQWYLQMLLIQSCGARELTQHHFREHFKYTLDLASRISEIGTLSPRGPCKHSVSCALNTKS